MMTLENRPATEQGDSGKPLASTLIICDSLSRLENELDKIDGPLRFLSLVDNVESRDICNYLRARLNTVVLSNRDLFRERSGAFW